MRGEEGAILQLGNDLIMEVLLATVLNVRSNYPSDKWEEHTYFLNRSWLHPAISIRKYYRFVRWLL
ncbi:hypothetical protein A6X21_07155 [Planctopirus hydrillae]|uniref:Uncharacterized protein n=1 Tax=Planctopirus hydrillae TaxID=1841610 RepID=A0A1C3E9E6_9PLAN|nr:hypothetical protein A6X21_07155 [Planctopirus hydrillae]